MSLSGLSKARRSLLIVAILGLPILGGVAYATQYYVISETANHRIRWPEASGHMHNGVVHIRNSNRVAATLTLDTSGIPPMAKPRNLAIDFNTSGRRVHDANRPRFTDPSPQSTSKTIYFDFSRYCGKRGRPGVFASFTLGDQMYQTNNWFVGDWILIDCRPPEVTTIRLGRTTKRLAEMNNFCFGPGNAHEIAVHTTDDTGVDKVELKAVYVSSRESLRVSPAQVSNPAQYAPAARGGILQAARFTLNRSGASSLNNVELRYIVTDRSGRVIRKSSRVNFAGSGAGIWQVNETPPRTPVSPGQNMVFGGNITSNDCQARGRIRGHAQVLWQIMKVPNAGHRGPGGTAVKAGFIKLGANRSPYLISYQAAQPGYYRMIMKLNNQPIHEGRVVQVGNPGLRRPATKSKHTIPFPR